MCETKPISYGLGPVARGASEESGGDAQPTKSRIVQNEPNLPSLPPYDRATDCLFPSPMVAPILGGHRQPKNRNGKG
jgi:hypothetical protein